MNITIKNVKHSEFASHETHCFECTVYVDNKRFCLASNDGQGGPDNHYPLKGQTNSSLQKQINAFDFGTHEFMGTTFPITLETIVGERINEYLLDKDIKRTLRKITYVKNGEVYTVAATFKPTTINLERIKTAKWWKPEYIMLNGMPISEIRKYFSVKRVLFVANTSDQT